MASSNENKFPMFMGLSAGLVLFGIVAAPLLLLVGIAKFLERIGSKYAVINFLIGVVGAALLLTLCVGLIRTSTFLAAGSNSIITFAVGVGLVFTAGLFVGFDLDEILDGFKGTANFARYLFICCIYLLGLLIGGIGLISTLYS